MKYARVFAGALGCGTRDLRTYRKHISQGIKMNNVTRDDLMEKIQAAKDARDKASLRVCLAAEELVKARKAFTAAQQTHGEARDALISWHESRMK